MAEQTTKSDGAKPALTDMQRAERKQVGLVILGAWLTRKDESPLSVARKCREYTDAFLAEFNK